MFCFLSQGLDDFPRASHPTDDERHIDLRCWMTLFARVMARLASVVTQFMQADQNANGRSKLEETRSLIAEYTRWADLLSDENELDRLHWSEKQGRYADYGLHTDFVRLEMPDIPKGSHVTDEVVISCVDISFSFIFKIFCAYFKVVFIVFIILIIIFGYLERRYGLYIFWACLQEFDLLFK